MDITEKSPTEQGKELNNNNKDTKDLSDSQTFINDIEQNIKDVNEPEQNEQSKKFNNEIFLASDLLNRNIKDIPCLLNPLLPKVGLVGFAGSSDTGKSSFLRQLAIAVALGEPTFLGFELKTEHKKAIYVSTEDDENAISFLLSKANQQKLLPPDRYKGLSFIFDTTNLLEKLDHELSISKRDTIIIDAFTDLYGRSMNDTNQVRTFLNDYNQLAQRYKCLVIFLHHTGKRTEDLLPSKHNLLGSQGFEAKMRTVFELRTDSLEPIKRHLCIVKANYLPKEYKTESYVLIFDDNLQFSITSERRLFDELKMDSKVIVKEQVKNLHGEGYTQIEIANKLKISQTSVSRYLNE